MISSLWSVSFLVVLLSHSSQSDHVAVIRCAAQPSCLANVDWETLKVIKENMYNTTDPCENFWDYACGSWTEKPYYDHVDTFGALTNYYADQMMATLESLQKLPGFDEISLMLAKIWQYFEGCRSSGTYYLQMSKYLKELPVAEIFGGSSFQWQQLFDSDAQVWQKFDWLQSLAALRPYGFNGVFLQESMDFASNDAASYVVKVKIPPAKKTFLSKYKIFEILEEFQFDTFAPTQELWQLAQDIYAFDKEIIELYRRYEESVNNVRVISLEQLKSTVSLLEWQSYFDSLAGYHLDAHRVQVEVSGKLEYFKDLKLLLQAKDNYTIASYVLVNFCKHLVDSKPLITDRDCLLHTNAMFPLGLSHIYGRFLYKNRREDDMVLQNIFQNLKKQFDSYLAANKFQLNQEELQYLRKKLSAIQLQIGNLPLQLPPLNDYYSSVQLSEGNFYGNHLEMLKFRFHQQHQALRRPDATHPNNQTYYVNDDISTLRNAPYFIHPRNLLMVPMVFLQLPFYHHAQHSLFQYSLVGWIMAHEISHAFDQYGLTFDAQGNYSPLGFQISLKPAFLNVLQCLSDKSPTLSLNERMADVNGLQLVWEVYAKNYLATAELPSDYSIQHLFFLNFAQFFCGSLPPAIAHDQDDVRVKETLENLREFTQLFHCGKKGNGENPSKPCNIWRK